MTKKDHNRYIELSKKFSQNEEFHEFIRLFNERSDILRARGEVPRETEKLNELLELITEV